MNDSNIAPTKEERPVNRQPIWLDSLLTVRATAKYLGVSRKRVYQLIDEKRLRTVRLSERGTRIVESSLRDYVESKRQT